MRRLASVLVLVLLLSACGGGSGDDGVPAAVADPSPSSTAAGPGDAASRNVAGPDAVCQDLGDWLGGVGFGGATDDPDGRLGQAAEALVAPYGSQVEAVLDGGGIDFGRATETDLATLELCGFPLFEGAQMAALTGAPDCYLDADREVIVDSLCELGGKVYTVDEPVLSDPLFCGEAQAFVRNGAGSLVGQAAIDELNRFVATAPREVERPLRSIVSAVAAGDTEAQLRDLFAVDRIVGAGCGDSIAAEYLALVRAAIAAVPPPTTPPVLGETPPDLPPEVAGGSPYVELCQAIEARFVGSAHTQWALVLDIANSVGAPASVIGALTQLADPAVVGDEARGPLVAALQSFIDGPCQNTGLDQAGGPAPPAGSPPDDGGDDSGEDDDVPVML